MTIKDFIKSILPKHKHKWTVIRTIWPYKEGYGVICNGGKTLLESGLSRDKAKAIANYENNKKVNKTPLD